MNGAAWSLLSLQLGVILAVALALGHAFRKLGQPAVVGEILGGVVLGPTLLGRFSPETFQALFPATGDVADARNAILRTGMLFFIFTIGAEVSIRELVKVRKEALWMGSVGTFTPLLLGFGLAFGFPQIINVPVGKELQVTAFLGAILSLSANPVIARILMDLNIYKEKIGTLIMSATLVDDLVGWGLFAVLLAKFAPGKNPNDSNPAIVLFLVFGFVALVIIIGRYIMPWVLRVGAKSLPRPMGTLMILAAYTLLCSAGADALGVHGFLGAFLAGVSLSDGLAEFQTEFESLSSFSLAVFTPAFFLCMGIAADFIAGFDLALVALITITAFFGKILGVFVGGKIAGLDSRMALAAGAGLNARGILGLVMAGAAFESKLIDLRVFVACVVMCLITTMAAGPALQAILGQKLSIPKGSSA